MSASDWALPAFGWPASALGTLDTADTPAVESHHRNNPKIDPATSTYQPGSQLEAESNSGSRGRPDSNSLWGLNWDNYRSRLRNPLNAVNCPGSYASQDNKSAVWCHRDFLSATESNSMSRIRPNSPARRSIAMRHCPLG